MTSKLELSAADARMLALSAQGFASGPLGAVTADDVAATFDTVAAIQIDSANVFLRSHYLPFYSRLGPYDRELLDALTGVDASARPAGRPIIECWAHEASLAPATVWPLLRWRMREVRGWQWVPAMKKIDGFDEVAGRALDWVREHGLTRASDLGKADYGTGPRAIYTIGDNKLALEYLFWMGRLAVAGRVNFERYYDLPERVLPTEVVEEPELTVGEAQRQLILKAAAALGIATMTDLGDYFRLPRRETAVRVAELVSAGALVEVAVEGWQPPAFVVAGTEVRRPVSATTLLSPFDSLVWTRARTELLFGFRHKIELYVPQAKREFGYYVLPFLLGDRLVARVDLKSDREGSALTVQSSFVEPNVDVGKVADALAEELHRMSTWLGLDSVVFKTGGEFQSAVAAAS